MRATPRCRTRPGAAVYRRRRLAAVALATALVALLITLLFAVVAPAPSRAEGSSGGRTVVVNEGDTIWDLAMEHAPEGADPVAYMADVVAHNDIRPRSLRAGMVVRLP